MTVGQYNWSGFHEYRVSYAPSIDTNQSMSHGPGGAVVEQQGSVGHTHRHHLWTLSSVGQSSGLLNRWSWVRTPECLPYILRWCSGQTYPPFKRGEHRFKSDTEDHK